MDRVKLSMDLLEFRKKIDNMIKDLTKGGCVCETNVEPDSIVCGNELMNWRCFKCGAIQKVVYCQYNHMLYDCPYCGQHLT